MASAVRDKPVTLLTRWVRSKWGIKLALTSSLLATIIILIFFSFRASILNGIDEPVGMTSSKRSRGQRWTKRAKWAGWRGDPWSMCLALIKDGSGLFVFERTKRASFGGINAIIASVNTNAAWHSFKLIKLEFDFNKNWTKSLKRSSWSE